MSWIDDVKLRLKNATPGPWAADDGNISCEAIAEARFHAIEAGLRDGVAGARYPMDKREQIAHVDDENPEACANEELIQHAPEDLKRALEEIDMLYSALMGALVKLRCEDESSASKILIDAINSFCDRIEKP